MDLDELVGELRRINIGVRGSESHVEVHGANAVREGDGILIVLDLTVDSLGVPISAWLRTTEEDHSSTLWQPTNLAGLVSLMLDEQIGTERVRDVHQNMECRDARWWLKLT